LHKSVSDTYDGTSQTRSASEGIAQKFSEVVGREKRSILFSNLLLMCVPRAKLQSLEIRNDKQFEASD